MDNLKNITTVLYGKSTLPGSMVFHHGDPDERYPIGFYLYLLKRNNKTILIDAGCDDLPGFILEDFKGPVKALAQIGISPEDITDLIITHSHHDHIACCKYYKNAVVHIQKDEYKSSGSYLKENEKINIFEDEFLVCEGVKIVKIGGHSKGSCIVEIDDNIVATGDECYLKDCIEKKIPTGTSFCFEKSKAFIEKYSDPRYTLLFAHSKD